MPRLLVSVRSAAEARDAWSAGASIIDAKEPANGPLGPTQVSVWRDIRAVLPQSAPMSVALGELPQWRQYEPVEVPGIRWRKLGLAGTRDDPAWSAQFEGVVRSLPGPEGWIAVAYADSEPAAAPDCGEIIGFAARLQCAGVLIDTYDKSRPSPIHAGPPWSDWATQIRAHGMLFALAGRLDASAFERLRPLRPDIWAVRGAACRAGDRLQPIDPDRVAALARAICASR